MVKFYKVTTNTKSVLDSSEPLITLVLSTVQYITLFYVFLFKDTLLNRYSDSLTLNTWATVLLLMTEQNLSNT